MMDERRDVRRCADAGAASLAINIAISNPFIELIRATRGLSEKQTGANNNSWL